MSGASTWVVNLAKAFKESGHEPIILSNGTKPKVNIDKELNIITLGRPRSNIFLKLWRILQFHKIAPLSYKKLETRVINSRIKRELKSIENNGKVEYLVKNFTDKLPESLSKYNQVSVIHSMISESWNDPNIRDRKFDCPGKILTVSHASKLDAESVGLKIDGVVKNPISILQTEELAKEYIVNGDYILFVGKLHIGKGILHLLEAFVKSKTKHKLYYLGIGKDEQLLRKKIKEYGVEENVKVLGFHKNPMPYIKQAKLLVLPSFSEAMGYVCVEAIILKTPFIVSNFSSAYEFYYDEHIVSMTPSEDFTSRLANKINDTLSSDFNFSVYNNLLDSLNYKSVAKSYIDFLQD